MDLTKGTLYFTDVSNRRVRAVDLTTGAITTVAGGGGAGPDESGPATAAALSSHPMRVAVHDRDLYISDALHHRIQRVDATGRIESVAGNGLESFSGDGGPATAASLAEPHCVRFDGHGNWYIADSRNHRIRRVDGATGVITTVAGNGEATFSGDGGAAVEASLSFPLAVAPDADGNLYIVDTDNGRIRRVDAGSGRIGTVAGSGQIGPLIDGAVGAAVRFGRLRDLIVAADGQLIVTDSSNSVVVGIDPADGAVRRIAGTGTEGFAGDGGPAVEADLGMPYSIALDEEQNLFIKDSTNLRIRRVEASSATIATIAGNGETGFSGDGGHALEARLATG
jgi:sugar lactone lactonase YvrE